MKRCLLLFCLLLTLGLTSLAGAAGPSVKLLAGFEQTNPFGGGTVVAEHATEGSKALRIDRSYVAMDGPQDWTGYDYLELDLYTDARDPMDCYVEIQDKNTHDYWTRVNYNTIVPPGKSTLILPVKQLYVGEKSRPGRMLLLSGITRLAFSLPDKPQAPVFLDNVRLVRDDAAEKVQFPGLHAFDFGTTTSPVMDGFTRVTPDTRYTQARGYGLKDAKIYRAFDVLQPDPLYEDFICIESGGFAVDVPNGKYRVFVNLDNPSGFWGEYQAYTKRSLLAEGVPVATDTMDVASFTRKYFRFWNSDDLPAENTFDKYQQAYYHEKTFDVDVKDGQLNLDFQGKGWACSVSAIVIFPVEKAAEGQRFLAYVQARRRFYFDNYFKRVLHPPTGDPLQPSAADRQRGYVVFTRDFMQDVFYNATPFRRELGRPLSGEGFAGEYEPLTVSVVPLRDLGKVTVTVSDLTGPHATIPASALHVGYVSYRVTRVSAEGSVYTIAPRLIMPTNTVAMPARVTRRFWLTVKVPAHARLGLYRGSVRLHPARGAAMQMPITFRVRKGRLDPVDVPAGPFSYTIDLPWPGPEAAQWDEAMARKSLQRLHASGFTSFSGLPVVTYRGWKDHKPDLDFRVGDAQMKMAKQAGFTLPVIAYGDFRGLNLYAEDTPAMRAAGFSDYSQFLKAVFSAVQQHAEEAHWLPVYWALGDEPLGPALPGATANAEAFRQAFPKGPPFFTLFTSYEGKDAKDPHFLLAKALHAPALNGHDAAAVNLLHEAGDDWGFYNGGNRWTFGIYMFKAAHQFGMKFRVAWHWNASAGDPYYALDCREDDYAWCTATPDGRLMDTIFFARLRQGLGDYRRLLTLDRLAKVHPNTPAARAARKFIDSRLAAFTLGQRDEQSLASIGGWNGFRRQVDDAIEAVRAESGSS